MDPLERLREILFHQDDYFEKKLCSVELSIDKAITEHLLASGEGTMDDYNILLTKLDRFWSL